MAGLLDLYQQHAYYRLQMQAAEQRRQQMAMQAAERARKDRERQQEEFAKQYGPRDIDLHSRLMDAAGSRNRKPQPKQSGSSR